jgi:hypothetical protein
VATGSLQPQINAGPSVRHPIQTPFAISTCGFAVRKVMVIRCTADPAKADKRTRSQWSRVMRYAAVYKQDLEPLGRFIRRKGGINACAGRFTRWRKRAER